MGSLTELKLTREESCELGYRGRETIKFLDNYGMNFVKQLRSQDRVVSRMIGFVAENTDFGFGKLAKDLKRRFILIWCLHNPSFIDKVGEDARYQEGIAWNTMV